jgi:nucleotide-binding universal stress UspA family protein
MFPIRTILHPTDFSANAGLAFEVACSLATDHNAQLIVLHVEEQSAATYGTEVKPLPDHRSALEKQLQGIQSSDANVNVEHRLERGIADTEILRVAQETGCDLIVMGTQGKLSMGKSVLPGRWEGSVAGKVLRSAPCAVVMVKTPDAVDSMN